MIYVPGDDELFSAQIGEGAYLNNTRLQVNQGELTQVGLVSLGFSPKSEIKTYLDTIARLMAHGVEHRRYGTAAICLAHTAASRFDGFQADFV